MCERIYEPLPHMYIFTYTQLAGTVIHTHVNCFWRALSGLNFQPKDMLFEFKEYFFASAPVQSKID